MRVSPSLAMLIVPMQRAPSDAERPRFAAPNEARSARKASVNNALLDLILHYAPGFATSTEISHEIRQFSLYLSNQIVSHTGVHLKLNVPLIGAARFVNH